MKCLIGASGLGDWWIYTIESVQSEEKADHLAWSLACEQYESYVGSYGIRYEETIMEEEDCSYQEASDIFQEEREQSIEYWISFDIENKINELLKKGSIDSTKEIQNYEKWKNQD